MVPKPSYKEKDAVGGADGNEDADDFVDHIVPKHFLRCLVGNHRLAHQFLHLMLPR